MFIWAQLQVELTLLIPTNRNIKDLEHQIPYLDHKVYHRQINLRGYARRITQLFTIARVRRATLASFIVMCAQQMTGVNVFAFLASTLFATGPVGRPDKGSLWLYFGFGIANFLLDTYILSSCTNVFNFNRSSAVAYFFIDKKGRRWLLMVSLTLMFPLLLATAFSFNADPWQGPVTVFLILYTLVSPSHNCLLLYSFFILTALGFITTKLYIILELSRANKTDLRCFRPIAQGQELYPFFTALRFSPKFLEVSQASPVPAIVSCTHINLAQRGRHGLGFCRFLDRSWDTGPLRACTH